MTDRPTILQPTTQPAPRPTTRPIEVGPRRPGPRVMTR